MRNIYVGSVEDNSDIISQSINDEVRNLSFKISRAHMTVSIQTRHFKKY